MDDYLTFRKMITPIIIQVVFWIGAVIIALYALLQIFRGATSNYGGGTLVLAGLVTLLLGPLFWRIFCELLIVIFRINDTLTEIKGAKGAKK
ncbi:MAG: hypothetical protein AMJ88_00365 [Anaerolineae bacterium SM23_ 63]|nr:MAG: hypothetical protein AMJ88_00365 [Anaerolineae bacterium SM23_ 63]HEY47242.1 DUF4282 domain-containing protein [Anaerolineae bacterium]